MPSNTIMDRIHPSLLKGKMLVLLFNRFVVIYVKKKEVKTTKIRREI